MNGERFGKIVYIRQVVSRITTGVDPSSYRVNTEDHETRSTGLIEPRIEPQRFPALFRAGNLLADRIRSLIGRGADPTPAMVEFLSKHPLPPHFKMIAISQQIKIGC